MDDWIGYRWLSREYDVDPVQPFHVSSRIGKGRVTKVEDGFIVESHPEANRPEPTLAAHLAFALRREGVHLEFLARLFDKAPTAAMAEWISREPTGQYARRAGFLYEWLTGAEIDRAEFHGDSIGNYVPALPEKDHLTSRHAVNIPRWRVRDNLPGTGSYCPTIRRTQRIQAIEKYDLKSELGKIESEFGLDILQRSAVWLTIKESRASFQIEHEGSQTDRIKRFASVIEKLSGTSTDPLTPSFLEDLQTRILGHRAHRLGFRLSPVFIGEAAFSGEIVHYVAPHWDDAGPMLHGLQIFSRRTRGQSPLLRAAVLAFGFVYIHPMADGNGRISRFLVNDTLRRDGASPEPYILPISSTISRSMANRTAYDRALERFSKPLMDRYASACSFGQVVECGDGIRTNFHFSAYDKAKFAWAFPDLTIQAEYLGEVIRETVETEMRQEAEFLLDFRVTRERVKEVYEFPDVEVDRIIRAVRQNRGVTSGKLVTEFPILSDPAINDAIVAAVLGQSKG